MADLRQTQKYTRYMRSIGWQTERVNAVNYFIRKLPIFGSFMKIQRPRKIDLAVVSRLQKNHRVLRTIIEPLTKSQVTTLIGHGYRKSSPYLPSKTIHIDLLPSASYLLKKMHHKTRYNIRHATQMEVKIKQSKDIESFTRLWKNAKLTRKLFGTKDIVNLYKAFNKDAHLLMAYKGNTLLGGVLSIFSGGVCYYMYAVCTKEGKRNYVPTLLVWRQIMNAKKKGCKVFDFEGIYDERFPIKDWKGFSRFKKGFGGKEIEYPGAFCK